MGKALTLILDHKENLIPSPRSQADLINLIGPKKENKYLIDITNKSSKTSNLKHSKKHKKYDNLKINTLAKKAQTE